MQTGYEILHVDGAKERGEATLPDGPGAAYSDIKAIVEAALGGGDLERVNVWNNGRYVDMFVDERGHHKGLPRNERATAIYRANVLTHAKNPPAPEDMPWIAGTAVLFDEKVWT